MPRTLGFQRRFRAPRKPRIRKIPTLATPFKSCASSQTPVCSRPGHQGKPTELALADWLEEMEVYGTAKAARRRDCISAQTRNRELVSSEICSGPLKLRD